MAYTGRHRSSARTTRSSYRRGVARKSRIVVARELVFATLTNAAGPTRINPLVNLEARIGDELWGATVLRFWGEVSLYPAVTAVTPGWFFWGLMASKLQLVDMAAGHPSPSYFSTNTDRYGNWQFLGQSPTPYVTPSSPNLTSPVPRTRTFMSTKTARLSQPEDELILATEYDGGTVPSTMNYQMAYAIALRLP